MPFLGVSILLLSPCLLPAWIQAGDLASHLYNTWLVQLLRSHQVSGLQIVPQYTNVLFDILLDCLWRLGGPVFAEKAAVSASVLVFFWGSFFLASRIAGRRVWPLAPILAMLAYGWVFHRGFFNYHLACGLSFWALALLWERKPRLIGPAATLLVLAATGHALPAAIAAALGAYVWLIARVPPRGRILMLAPAIAALGCVRITLAWLFPVRWSSQQILNSTGADQFLIYGPKFLLPVILVIAVWAALVLRRCEPRGIGGFTGQVDAQALILCLSAAVILPAGIHFTGMQHALLFIDRRVSVWVALLACAAAGGVPLRRGELAVPLLAMASFFSFMAWDQNALNRLELRFARSVQALPRSAKVVSAISGTPPAMNPVVHMIDRACIGRCFSYANYEPGCWAFRLRALPGAPVVIDNYADSYAMQSGSYVVRPRDLPLYAILPKPGTELEFALRPLGAGEKIPFIPIPYPPDWF